MWLQEFCANPHVNLVGLPVSFAYTLPAQPAGGEDQENLQVADTEDMSVEQLAEQLKNL